MTFFERIATSIVIALMSFIVTIAFGRSLILIILLIGILSTLVYFGIRDYYSPFNVALRARNKKETEFITEYLEYGYTFEDSVERAAKRMRNDAFANQEAVLKTLIGE